MLGSIVKSASAQAADLRVRSAAAAQPRRCAALGEFILPYNAVAAAVEPDALLIDFLSTTYAAAADAGGWDRSALECPFGVPGRARPI